MRVRTVLAQCGIWFDEGLNVLIGGQADQTLSLDAALACRAGRMPACLFCRFLSYAVQRHHCARQIEGTPMHPLNYMRAGILLAIAYGVLFWIVRTVVALLLRV